MNHESVISALEGAAIDALQKLSDHWVQQAHMFGSSYRQPINTKVSNHFRYSFKRFAKLSKNIGFQFLVALYPHVHEASCAPETNATYDEIVEKRGSILNIYF